MPWIFSWIYVISHWLASTPLSGITVWMATTPLSTALNQNAWITPIVESIHILAIAVTFSAALMINLRILKGAAQNQSMPEVEHRYAPWIWWGLLVLTITGVLFVIAEPARELLSGVFWTKMVLITAVALANLQFQKAVQHHGARWEPGQTGAVARVGAGALIAVWCVIIILGRWIAYAGI